MKKLICSFILFIPILLFAQTAKRGIIVPAVDSLKYSDNYCCVLSPPQGFSVYDSPKGKVIGTLKRVGDKKKDDQFAYKIYLVSGGTKLAVDNYREVGYEIFAINYTEAKEGFVKVLNEEKSYWLNVSEIEKQGFKTVAWLDHLIAESKTNLGYYANEPGLRLRKAPNVTSEILKSINGDLFEIKLTNQTNGQWCKVKVKKYKEHPCNSDLDEKDNLEYELEGWLKVIDDDGELNIWSYTRGC